MHTAHHEPTHQRRRLPLPAGVTTTFQSLEDPRFARYWLGTLAFFWAMNMQIMLRGWLVYKLTDDALALGMINAAFAIPTLVFSPIGGVVADRFDRRKVIVFSQLFQLALTVLTTVLVLTHTVHYWHLLVLSVLAAAAGSFNFPARAALVPALVGRDRLMNAIALNTGAMNVSRIAAPALAGVLVAPIGIGGGFIVTLVFYALAVALFAGVKGSLETDREERPGFVAQMTDGMRYVAGAPAVALLLMVGIVPMLLAMPQQILLPAFSDVFHTGAAGVGVMQAAAGVGGLAGSIVAANVGRPRRPALLMTLCMVAFGGCVLLFALSPHFTPALVALAAGDLAVMFSMTVNTTVMNEIVPDDMRGRVMSLNNMTFGLTPLAVLPASAAAEAVGVQATVAVGGVLLLGFAVCLYLFSRSFRGLDQPAGSLAVARAAVASGAADD